MAPGPRQPPLTELRGFALLAGLRLLIAAAGLTLLTWLWQPHWLWAFPRTRPGLWLLVMLAYPWLSALPQEYLYRRFLMGRYAALIPDPRLLTGLGVLLFAWLHLPYDNLPALVLAGAGGAIFAHTFARTGRLWCAGLEHAAYGLWLFTVGLGRFFYESPTAG